jgi:PIN domain nuclease of toxin-antitoxin system
MHRLRIWWTERAQSLEDAHCLSVKLEGSNHVFVSAISVMEL